MKKFYRLKLQLLTPLFYWSKLSANTVFTDDYIGDLALYYAINRIAKIKNVQGSFYGKFYPNYPEIKEFDFWISCARPISVKRTDLYAHKTEFKAEVINSTPKLETKSGKSPFKNYYQQQGIEPLSVFEAIYYGERILIPPAIRIGTHLHTLVKVEVEEITKKQIMWLNLYSAQQIFNLKVDLSQGQIEYKLPIYMILETELNNDIKEQISKIFN